MLVSVRFCESWADCAMAIGLGVYVGPEAYGVASDDPAAEMAATARMAPAEASGRRNVRDTQ
jgi:hypothetical protein